MGSTGIDYRRKKLSPHVATIAGSLSAVRIQQLRATDNSALLPINYNRTMSFGSTALNAGSSYPVPINHFIATATILTASGQEALAYLVENKPSWLNAYAISSNLGCGFVSGMIVTGLLNPWDRALYLSLTKRRRFLDYKNFKNPYQGISQTLVQRSLSTGLYFPLEDFFLTIFRKRSYNTYTSIHTQSHLANILAGNMAGILNGLLLNPLSYIKYQCWGRNNYSFMDQAISLYRVGGIKVFFRGARATCARDAIFGAVYSLLRNLDLENYNYFDSNSKRAAREGAKFHVPGGDGRKNKPFVQDLLSAALATVVSAPFNFFRNIQYHEYSHKTCPTMGQLSVQLMGEIQRQKTFSRKLKLIQHRLRIGWGTLRVAVGMALGSKLYSVCHQDVSSAVPNLVVTPTETITSSPGLPPG